MFLESPNNNVSACNLFISEGQLNTSFTQSTGVSIFRIVFSSRKTGRDG